MHKCSNLIEKMKNCGPYRRLQRMKIRQQLHMIYAIAIMLPIMMIGVFLLYNTHKLLVNYHMDMLQSYNHRIKNVLFEITTQVYNLSESITFDENMQKLWDRDFADRESYVKAVERYSQLDHYEDSYAEISSIDVYVEGKKTWDYKQYHYVTEEIRSQDWYQRALNQSGVFWQDMTYQDNYGNTYWTLCLVRKIPCYYQSKPAVLVIQISDNYLRTRLDSGEMLNMISVDDSAVFYSSDRMLSGERQPVAIDMDAPYFAYSGSQKLNGKQCFVEVSTLHTYMSDSSLYITTINDKGYADIISILNICVIILLFSVVLPGMVIFIFTGYFTKRVNILRQEMHKASRQDYELIQSFHGEDELSEVFEDLKTMVTTIKAQEAKIYTTQIREQNMTIRQQQMEFQVLASQINPHFLYNTLESIRMKAFTGGDLEVAQAIKLLGKSMRYVLDNSGSTTTTLKRELEHVKAYVQIQKFRFGDRINYEEEIDDRIYLDTYKIPPLILQPVVENAIVHGLEDKEKKGFIRIVIRQEERENHSVIIVEIKDNGCGMDEEQLRRLKEDIERKDLSKSKSIGLSNINQRMKMYYGSQYQLLIASEKGEGTSISLIFPERRM